MKKKFINILLICSVLVSLFVVPQYTTSAKTISNISQKTELLQNIINLPGEAATGVQNVKRIAYVDALARLMGQNFEVSQTIIITRPEGRTPKPSKEALCKLAEHNATMCIFLGIHMIDDVVTELLKEYREDTPVAVVKKATWPDQEIVRGNLTNIAQKVHDAGFTKTAMIVVGDVLDQQSGEQSKLYDPKFAHMYRDAE